MRHQKTDQLVDSLLAEGWVREFDASYDVPAWATQVPGTFDSSWHNDAMPSFRLDCQEDDDSPDTLVLWVDHPVPAERERTGYHRFTIAKGGEDIWSGDDEAEAQREWLKAVAAVVKGAESAEDAAIHQ